MDELERRIADLRQREALDAIRPDLDGNQVMARLGIRPGRAVGEALAFLMELRLDEGPLGEEEAGPTAGRVVGGRRPRAAPEGFSRPARPRLGLAVGERLDHAVRPRRRGTAPAGTS